MGIVINMDICFNNLGGVDPVKCYEIDLSRFLRVTLLNKSEFVPPILHCTRYTEEYIVYVIESGMLSLIENGEELKLYAGDVYMFDKGEFQRPKESTACNFYYMHFQTDGVCALELSDDTYNDTINQRKMSFMKADIYGSSSYDHTKVLLKQRFNIKDNPVFEKITAMLRNHYIAYGYNTPAWRINISYGAAAILLQLEGACLESMSSGSRSRNTGAYGLVKKVGNYIEEHFRENFGSADIERDLLINFDYANRVFKKYTGNSIIKYRNRLRINTAKALLCERSLEDIAFEVGFCDRYYFSRCFKNFEGISPDAYRGIIQRNLMEKTP